MIFLLTSSRHWKHNWVLNILQPGCSPAAFLFVIFILVLQQIEGNLIYPRVVGQSVGLPGVWVLAAVTVGGALFGVWGMLFSVPICTVIYTVFKQYVNNKNKNTEEDSDVAEQTEERLL